MIRSLGWLTLAVVLAGCHSSPTSRFATRSMTRVPPPGTGSYPVTPGNPYYEGKGKTGNGVGATEAGASVSGLATTSGSNSVWQSRGALSDLTTPVGTAIAASPIATGPIVASPIVASPATSVAPATFIPANPVVNAPLSDGSLSNGLRLRGMVVNDGTAVSAPATFVAPNAVRPIIPGVSPVAQPNLQPFAPVQTTVPTIQAAPISNGSTGWIPASMPISAAPVLPMSFPTMNLARTEFVEVPVRMTPAPGTPLLPATSGNSSGSSSDGAWKSKYSAG